MIQIQKLFLKWSSYFKMIHESKKQLVLLWFKWNKRIPHVHEECLTLITIPIFCISGSGSGSTATTVTITFNTTTTITTDYYYYYYYYLSHNSKLEYQYIDLDERNLISIFLAMANDSIKSYSWNEVHILKRYVS